MALTHTSVDPAPRAAWDADPQLASWWPIRRLKFVGLCVRRIPSYDQNVVPSRPAIALLALAAILSVADVAPGTTARTGGTLRIAAPLDLRSYDPALARPLAYPVWYATCATLMAFDDAPAPQGFHVRPEAAAGPPQISQEGRTYVFTVRQGLRFSDGSSLTAANFAVALRRVLNPAMQSDAAFLFSDVEGVRASGRHLRIRLRTPSGDLLTRLALSFACPVPLDFPVDPGGVDLQVASGPYKIATHIPDKLLVLVRNPYYRGTRPQRLDRVVVSFGGDLDSDIRAVENGQADVLGIEIPRDVRDVLAQRYGVNKGQFFRLLGTYTGTLVLNTSRPLFRNNVALRKAVNFAVDRADVIRHAGASALWFRATDQIVPSWIPGWRDYHIYPLGGPDLGRARKLAAGNLRGGKAVLYAGIGPGSLDQANVIVRDLGQIGLDVSVKPMSPEVIDAKAGVPGEPYDMLLLDFPPGFPELYFDPAMMLVRLLDGANARGSVGNTNFAYFDNPTYSRRLEAANRLIGAERFRAFSRLDAEIMRKQAPWAPLFEGANTVFVSKRVGCLKLHPEFRIDFAAMCVH
jgi:peptide/nickel transport system substrate-binding protein